MCAFELCRSSPDAAEQASCCARPGYFARFLAAAQRCSTLCVVPLWNIVECVDFPTLAAAHSSDSCCLAAPVHPLRFINLSTQAAAARMSTKCMAAASWAKDPTAVCIWPAIASQVMSERSR